MRRILAALLLVQAAAWAGPGLPVGTFETSSKPSEPGHGSFYDIVTVGEDHSMTWAHGESSMDSNSQSAIGTWSLRALKNGSWQGTFHIKSLKWDGYRPSGVPDPLTETSLFGLQVHPGDSYNFMLNAETSQPHHFQFTAFTHDDKPSFSQDLTEQTAH